VGGVDGQIHDRALQLRTINIDPPKFIDGRYIDRNIFADGPCGESNNIVEQLGQIREFRIQQRSARKCQKSVGQIATPLRRRDRPVKEMVGLGAVIDAGLKKLKIAQNNGQQVIEIMGDAARELSDSLHFLFMSELLFPLLTFGDTAQQNNERRDPALLQLADGSLGGEFVTILATSKHLAALVHSAGILRRVSKPIHLRAMAQPQMFRQQNINGLPDNLDGVIAKNGLGPAIEQDYSVVIIDRDDRIGRKFDNFAKARLGVFLCSDINRNAKNRRLTGSGRIERDFGCLNDTDFTEAVMEALFRDIQTPTTFNQRAVACDKSLDFIWIWM